MKEKNDENYIWQKNKVNLIQNKEKSKSKKLYNYLLEYGMSLIFIIIGIVGSIATIFGYIYFNLSIKNQYLPIEFLILLTTLSIVMLLCTIMAIIFGIRMYIRRTKF